MDWRGAVAVAAVAVAVVAAVFSLGLRAADGLVVGSRIEGGVVGFEP
jgi:hypothetical protein